MVYAPRMSESRVMSHVPHMRERSPTYPFSLMKIVSWDERHSWNAQENQRDANGMNMKCTCDTSECTGLNACVGYHWDWCPMCISCAFHGLFIHSWNAQETPERHEWNAHELHMRHKSAHGPKCICGMSLKLVSHVHFMCIAYTNGMHIKCTWGTSQRMRLIGLNAYRVA